MSPTRHVLLAAALGAAPLAGAPAAAHAQASPTPRGAAPQGVLTRITGRVTTPAGTPLANTTVAIVALGLGTQSGEDGSYTLAIPAGRAADGQVVAVTARRLGYAPVTSQVTLQPGNVVANFTLSDVAAQLSAVVVTGAGTESTVEKLGSTINSVASTEIVRSNETNVVNALAAKAPNVEVSSQSGDPGAGAFIRIRGASTIQGNGSPLFVVDGVPIDNSTVATGSYVASTAATNRAADINPADIESVEILKGAAAAAIYGARAAGGVVLITTKSGRAGKTSYSLRSSYSWDDVGQGPALQRKFGQGSGGESGSCDTPGCRADAFSWGPALAAGTPTYDHFGEVFKTGHLFDNSLTVSGGNERTTFFLSAARAAQDGVIMGPNNTYDRTSVRVRATHALTDRFHLGGTAAFVDARGAFVQKGSNLSGIMLGALRTPPEFDNRTWRDPVSGLHRSYRYPNPLPDGSDIDRSRGYDNPFFTAYSNPATSDVGRVFGNINADWQPIDWLTVKYTLGADYSNDQRLEAFAKTNSSYATGQVNRADFTAYQIDHNLIATGEHTFRPWLSGTLTLGQNLNSRRNTTSYVSGYDLLAPQPFQLNNTLSLISSPYESLVHTESYFGQGTLDLWEQLYLTGALRNDGFSTFGRESGQRFWFPKLSAAWTFSKVTGDFGGRVDFAKLRAAYGEAGREPGAYQTLSGYSLGQLFDGGWGGFLNPYQGGLGGYTSSSVLGQDKLRPERTKEVEAGFDFGLYKGLADGGLTFYNRKSVDVIFLAPLAPTTGYTAQAQNAATIRNRGWEAELNLHPVRATRFGWDLGFNWATNDNRVLDLAGAQFVGVSGSFTTPNAVAQKGSRVGVLRGFDFARCGRGVTLDDGRSVDALCGSAPRGALFIDADGYPVLDPTERLVMDPTPKWTAGVRNTFSVGAQKQWQLSSLVDVRRGGHVWNGTRSALTFRGLAKDTEIRGQSRTFGKDFFKGPVAGPGANSAVVIDENWFSGLGSTPEAAFVEPGGFVKLREVSVSYNLAANWLQRWTGFSSADLRLAGRNLNTWTKYSGVDPETNLGGAEVQLRGVDYFNNPQTRSVVFSIGLNR